MHEINTFRAEYLSQGMNHFEGGWPKDINPAENDQTMRFRKKIEKDDAYINSVLGLCQVLLQYGFWSFQGKEYKIRRFLANNHHTQRKLLTLENWSCWELSKIRHHFKK